MEPYKFDPWQTPNSGDHNTDRLIGVVKEILQALTIISGQLDELNKQSNQAPEANH